MTTTARRRLHPRTLDDLAVLPRWVAWREEIRINKERKEYKAKIPYDPNTHQQARIPTEPSTWGSRDQAERRCRSLLHRNAVGGVGIVLGEFDDGTLLMGIDLDSCFTATNTIAPWAVEVLERFNTYAEVSPSGRGVKLFFFVAAKDADTIKQLFGRDAATGKLKTRKAFVAGGHREIAIDRARFYAVTGERLDHVPDLLRSVEIDDVRWFLEEAGPAYKLLHGVGSNEQRRDESGSGHGFRFMAARKRAGDSYQAARHAILADRGKAGEWARRVDERQLRRAWDNASSRAASRTQLDVVRVADVPMKRVDWVWPLRLARGKVTIISGDPGVGKSQIGIDAAARVTRQPGTWPDGDEPAPSGSVIILSAEDAIGDTIHPRLMAAEADVTRVHIIRAVTDARENRRTFNLQRDLDQLEQLIAEIGDVILVQIDPISSYMGEGIEGNAMTSVRPVLEAVAAMAERTNVAVMLIHHPPKHATGKALNAFSGSLAFVAAARMAFIVVPEEETERKLLLPVKTNLGTMAGGLGYYIKETSVGRASKSGSIKTSYIEWDEDPVAISANEALRKANGPQEPSKLERAKGLLREELADGPADGNELIALANELGISERTLRKAKDELRVKSVRTGFQGGSEWQLP
jgi:hypothetical protein